MICIYHSKDLDGYCSGAIVKKKYPECKLIGFDYWQKLPWDELPEGEEIIMVDVSVAPAVMAILAEHCGKLTWIDHHASAIKEFGDATMPVSVLEKITPVLQDGIAACEGTWNYLFPDEEMPDAVKLLGMYDTWRNDNAEFWNMTILPFQWYMRLKTDSAETFQSYLLNLVTDLSKDSIRYGKLENEINVGEYLLQYQQQQYKAAMSGAFEIEFQGLRAIACNIKGVGSLAFDSVYDPEKHDIIVAFGYGHGKWGFSLRTTHEHIDCSIIAKRFGGGGHKKAAGFGVIELSSVITLPVATE